MKRSIQKIKNDLKLSAKISLFLLFFIPVSAFSQETNSKLTQTIRGIIIDAASGESIPFASVSLVDNP